MVGCAAVGCKSNSSNKNKTVELVSYYRLPHDLKSLVSKFKTPKSSKRRKYKSLPFAF